MNEIEVIGLGAGDLEQLPLGIYRKLLNEKSTIFARTIDHPVIHSLEEEGVTFQTFDKLYEQHSNFQTVYEQIVDQLLTHAKHNSIIYAIPGHPMMAEKTVQLLLEQSDVRINIVGGQSFLDDLFTTLKIDPIDGFQLMDATGFSRDEINYRNHLIFCQLYDEFIASEVKLTLLEDLPADYEITIVDTAGSKTETLKKIPLKNLDRYISVSNRISLYVPPVPEELLNHTFPRLRSIIAQLRGENGCPWDKKQTHESLRDYAVEEVYELIEAINNEDDEAIIEELGDVLLQVMLHSQIGEDNGYFTIDDVIEGITKKMIHRHPHVFGDRNENKTWDELKAEEKPLKETTSILDHVVASSPALLVAYEVQKKVAKVGFDWSDVQEVWDKFYEEMDELTEAIEGNNDTEIEEELGDILFVLVNIAKFYQVNPELALRRSITKFMSRFNYVEEQVKKSKKKFSDFTLEQLDVFWNEKKGMER